MGVRVIVRARVGDRDWGSVSGPANPLTPRFSCLTPPPSQDSVAVHEALINAIAKVRGGVGVGVGVGIGVGVGVGVGIGVGVGVGEGVGVGLYCAAADVSFPLLTSHLILPGLV